MAMIPTTTPPVKKTLTSIVILSLVTFLEISFDMNKIALNEFQVYIFLFKP